MSVLETSIEYLKGVGPQRAALLKNELQVANFQDLLHLFPTKDCRGEKQSPTAISGYLCR